MSTAFASVFFTYGNLIDHPEVQYVPSKCLNVTSDTEKKGSLAVTQYLDHGILFNLFVPLTSFYVQCCTLVCLVCLIISISSL